MSVALGIGSALVGGIMSIFGANQSNNAARDAADRANENARQNWEFTNEQGERAYDFAVQGQEIAIRNNEANIAFQEAQLIQDWNFRDELRHHEYNGAMAAYENSVAIRDEQVSFNEIAANAALAQQDRALHEQTVGLALDDQSTMIDYLHTTTGINYNHNKALLAATMDDAKSTLSNQVGISRQGLERGKLTAGAQRSTQKAILEGMKAAGKARARGGSGRSSAKTIQAIAAESGAVQAAVANEFMFGDKAIDVNIGELNDMLILDKTRISMAKGDADLRRNFDASKNSEDFSMKQWSSMMTKYNTAYRDQFIRQQISQAQTQADMAANNAVEMMPGINPMMPVPDLLPRPEYQEVLEWEDAPEPIGQIAATQSLWSSALGGMQQGLSIGSRFVAGGVFEG